MPDAPRPVIDERRAYVPRARQERWIVPLLNKAILATLDAQCHPQPGDKALDAGCGGQPFRPNLEQRGYRYFGLDAVAAPGVIPDFLCPLDSALPDACRAAGPFQLILCTEVLEHVADWDAALRNLHALLAPGGTLILTCPFIYPLHEEPYDFWRPTHQAITNRAEKAGFRVRQITQLGTTWDVLGTIFGSFKPESRGGPLGWLLSRILRFQRKLACAICSSHFIRSRVDLRAPLYLSNLAVLTR